MCPRRFTYSPIIALLLLPNMASAGGPGAIGVLGDSYSDEYRFYPPDRSTARNWVEILASIRGVDFGSYSESGRGEPRNAGFAYNWARSDATTVDMVTLQLPGLVEQVARGEVGLVVVFIGGNDFINALHSSDPAGALGTTLAQALSNYRMAVREIRRAGPEVRLVLATLPDIQNLPEFAGPLREGRIPRHVADAYSTALKRFNSQIRALAFGDARAAIVDLDLATRAADLIGRESVRVAGRRLDRTRTGNDLDHFFLADVRHPGTLGQGLMARLFIEAVNVRFGADLEPLDDRELLDVAASATRDTPVPAPPLQFIPTVGG